MPVVRVDDDVWNWLKSHATPFEDTPNSVLRRVAGLDPVGETPAMFAPLTTVEQKARKTVVETKRLLRSSGDYVVTKGPDRFKHWWFQIYRRKLAQKARRGDFSVKVVCDYNAPSRVVFQVPYVYLRDNILPKAKLEPDKRYMFEVRKDSYEFVFHPGIRFDGRQFLVER